MRLPEYRPAYGFAVWLGASAADLVLVGGELEGGLSLLGLWVALAWALGPRSLLGRDEEPAEEGEP